MPDRGIYNQLMAALADTGARKASKFISATEVVSISRRRYKRTGKFDAHTYILTIGRPNYAQRRLVAAFKRAGEPFPVRKIQLAYGRQDISVAKRRPGPHPRRTYRRIIEPMRPE